MSKSLELLWFVCTVAPFVVLTIRTHAVCRKAREQQRAWMLAEQYIFGRTIPGAGRPPEPSSSSALIVDSDVQAIAA
jgi:hypothetical protein